MILVYTSYGCASCRKAKEWLKEHNLPFVEKNIFNSVLSDTELKFLLKRTENGTDDLISKRSKVLQDSNVDIDSMSTSELMEFIRNNPSVLRRPIILDEKNFLVGYDPEEIEIFKPRELRRAVDDACNGKCPNYEICGAVRKQPVAKESKA